MRKIAIINQKGGSGKTTTSVNLAAGLADAGRKVLVLDLDPQASTTSWCGYAQDTQNLLEVFTTNLSVESTIVKTSIKGVDLVPGSTWLIGLEKKLSQEVGAETILKHKFKHLDALSYDYLLIDCPPALSLLTINALNAVHEVIVPVETRIMALQGLVQLLQTIDVIKERLNSNLKLSGILACRVDVRTKHSKEVVTELRKNFGALVYKTVIRENIRLSEAPSFAESILEYAPDSSGAQDYKALAKELISYESLAINTATKKSAGKSRSINS